MVNLLNQQTPNEEMLTQGLKSLISQTSDYFESFGRKIEYDYFDFTFNCKKGTGLLDTYIADMLKNLYLRDIGFFCEKHTVYKHNSEL